MDYTKVSQQINDVVSDNVKKLAGLFPSAVKDGEVDFEALKEELGSFAEVGPEKYELTWAGKADAKRIAREDIVGKTLNYIPEESKDADTTENLYIEGDNLEVLKLLRQNYYGAIKMIYIDPPYNTGNDFVYNDSFAMKKEQSDLAEGIINELGERYTINKNSQNRYHTNWLNMIYPRLKIAKDLLREDGVIFISIGDEEVCNLKKIVDEIFGERNYITNLIWQSTPGSNTGDDVKTVTENILLYGKNKRCCKFMNQLISNNEKYSNKDEYFEKRGGYVLNKLDRRMTGTHYSEALNYPVDMPDGTKLYPGNSNEKQEHWNWRWSFSKVQWGIDNGFIVMKQSKDGWSIYFKQYEKVNNEDKPIERTVSYQNLLNVDGANSARGTREVMDLFDGKFFDYPKPLNLLMYLQNMVLDKEDIVIDFFSGSATTAQAIMQINAEDNGNRKYIMVQLPELLEENSEAYKSGYKTICDIGKERIRRAGEKIKTEHSDADIDTGFKVFRVAETNIKWNSLIDMGQLDLKQMETSPDTIDFMPNVKDVDVVYELMLRQRNIPLSLKIEQIFEGGYFRTYLYADSYLVCLETKITDELIDKLAGIDPLPIKFIFRDSAFQDDIALKDEAFRRLKALIEKNHGMNKTTYTVEFI